MESLLTLFNESARIGRNHNADFWQLHIRDRGLRYYLDRHDGQCADSAGCRW